MTEFIWNELSLLAEALERLQHNLANCVGQSDYREHLENRIDELLTRREHLAAVLRTSVAGEFIEAELVGFEEESGAIEPVQPSDVVTA